MNIKKIIAGSLAALTAGATLAIGALGLLVQDTTPPYVVIGADAQVIDTIAAADLAAYMASEVTTEVAVGGATTSVTDGYMITSDINKTYKDESFNNVVSTLTATELPDLLANYEFTDKNNSKCTVQQQIVLTDHQVTFGRREEEPVLYVAFPTSKYYNLTVYFLGGLDPTAVDTSYSITLFGREFTFGPTHTNTTLELYSKTGTETVHLSGAGDEATAAGHTFRLEGWATDGSCAYITIDGQSTSPSCLSSNTYYTIPGTDTRIYIKDVGVIATGAQEQTGFVDIFIGVDKLYLQNGQQVKKNDVAMTNTYAYFNSPSSDKINSITFKVTPDDDEYLVNGGEFVDPLFGTFKFKLSDMTPGLTSDARDKITVEQSGTNKVMLTFTNKVGTEYAFDVFYHDGTNWNRRRDTTHDVWVTEGNTSNWGAGNITKGDYFVLSKGDNTYVYQYSSHYYVSSGSTENYVEFKDISTGTSQKVYPNVDSYLRIGADAFRVWFNNTDKSVLVDLNGDGDAAVDSVNITTYGGAKIDLTEAGNVTIYENPRYTVGNDPSGEAIKIQAAHGSAGVTFTVPNVLQRYSEYIWEYVTGYGTYWYVTGDSSGERKVEIYYPGWRPAYANVAVGSDPKFTVGGATTVEQAVPITSPVSKFDTEITTTTLDRNVILVGGPCVNDLVKQYLDEKWNTTDSCADWVSKITTTNPAGLICQVSDFLNTGKTALIVAGTTGEDTRALAQKVMQGTEDNYGCDALA